MKQTSFDIFAEDETSLNVLENMLKEDSIYSEIINTELFNRLKNISFLGAIDYSWHNSLAKTKRNRYAHTISVACLALYVSQKRNYSKEVERLLVITALMHDIGHIPLSHSTEPVFKKQTGLGHHEIGMLILEGDLEESKKICSVIKNETDISQIKLILLGKSKEGFSDIFNNPINIDTIDGVLRTLSYINSRKSTPDPLSICEEAFVQIKEKSSTLDSFWLLKESIYKNFILTSQGLISDYISRDYFESYNYKITLEDAIQSEKHWLKKFPKLFSSLKEKNLTNQYAFTKRNIEYVNRSYYIEKSKNYQDRYKCTKETNIREISFNLNESTS